MLIMRMIEDPLFAVILIPTLIFALTLHEFGHAYVAYLCGDRTAQLAGRMNINPLAHLDMIGSLMLLTVGFGYAKPVPVNPRNFKYRNADFFVSAAGPGMNFLLMLAGGILLNILAGQNQLDQTIGNVILFFMFVNMNLCLFNLIPLGPLDGSYVLPHFLPSDLRYKYRVWNAQYGTPILMGMLMISFVLPNFSPFRWIGSFSQSIVYLVI